MTSTAIEKSSRRANVMMLGTVEPHHHSTSPVPNEDERANFLSSLVVNGGGVGRSSSFSAAKDLGQALAERAQLISSVNWLGNHVPVCVLNRLGEELRIRHNNDGNNNNNSHGSDDDESSSALGEDSIDEFSQESAAAILEELRSLKREYAAQRRSLAFLGGPAQQQQQPQSRRGSSADGSISLGDSCSSIDEQLLFDAAQKFGGKRRQSGTAGRRASSAWRIDNLRESVLAGSRRSTRQSYTSFTQQQQKRDSYHSFGEISELSFDFDLNSSDDGFDRYDSSADLGNFSNGDLGSGSGVADSATPRDDKQQERDTLPPCLRLPYASRHHCALLFVDISGFTKLSTSMGPEALSAVINAYFNLIVNQVTSHGGDVLKFAGDGLFAEWQASSPDETTNGETAPEGLPRSTEPRRRISLEECVAAAATCGAKIVHQCSDYPVYANGASGRKVKNAGEMVASLNVHCGLGAGEVVGVHVGDNDHRREYLILGDPIDQVNDAAESASHGELLASPQALEIMAKRCKILDETVNISELSANKRPTLIARKSLAGFTPRMPKQQRRCSVAHLWEGWETSWLVEYRKLICLYAHPVVVENELNSSEQLLPVTAQQRQLEEAEIRTVYVMFISMPHVRVSMSGDRQKDDELFRLLNDILIATTAELDRFSGHLRQFIVDDKGLVLISTFGLRGSTFANMVTDRALPATTAIHNMLQDLDVFNRIGATVGDAYCGVVGGMKRHEFAVMGPSVNLAARLMSSPLNPGVLVDDAVRQKAGTSYAFNALPPVSAKGYAHEVPIFQPLSSMERKWGKLKPDFVGREDEIGLIVQSAKAILFSGGSPAKIIHVSAESGSGKTTMVVHAIEKIRRLLGRRRSFKIGKHVCRESDLLTPFSIFQSILLDIVAGDIEIDRDDKSLSTSQSGWSSSSGINSLHSESNFSWFSKSTGTSGTGKATKLLTLCDELNAPPEFAELIGHHLLGLEAGKIHAARRKSKRAPTTGSILAFMEKIFLRFTSKMKLNIIALDDVHLMDEMSWSVLQRLFHSCKNLLIVCTSRPIDKYKLLIDGAFWDQLTSKHLQEERFLPIHLSRLDESEVKQMIAKNLQVEEDNIDDQFIGDVYRQSRGMPHFASEILRSANRRSSIGATADTGNRIGWITADRGQGELSHASVGDLIVARLDSFDISTRNVLNLGAIFGQSFDLADIITIMHHFHDNSEDGKGEQVAKIQGALDLLVSEGILVEVCIGGVVEGDCITSIETPKFPVVKLGHDPDGKQVDDVEIKNKNYQFCHDIWRQTILKLMLQSHRQHIHRVIATIIENHLGDDSEDYVTRMKLFSHWKAAGAKGKAATLALKVGKNFEQLGLCDQGIQLYQDALNMWRDDEVNCADDNDDGIGGFCMRLLTSISTEELEFIIELQVSCGKLLGTMHRGADSVEAYQNALMILQLTQSASQISDRSIVFPIFSGLFQALKYGQIEQDDECTYEQNLVARFVHEAKLNGDPVHYTRALSMQAEMYGRLGMFDEAFQSLDELKQSYNVEEHSEKICKAYGSDKSAHCFGVSALWHFQLGNVEEALETCEYIFTELIPKMNESNVHNSCIMLYPTIWPMKDTGNSERMLDIFVSRVVDPFDRYLGDGAFTFCLPIYDPIMMLLELSCRQNDEVDNLDEILEWALLEDNLRFGTVINGNMTSYGRDANSLSAEICLLLASRDDVDHMSQIQLTRCAWRVANESLDFTVEKKAVPAQNQVRAILQKLQALAIELGLEL